MKKMKLLNLKEKLDYKFKKSNFLYPASESEHLIKSALNLSLNQIITSPQQKVGFFKILKINYWLKQRLKGVPLAYLKKEQTFYNLNFYVNKNVLVPRPESELYIDLLKNRKFNNSAIIDIGTGSGCLIVSLIKNAPDYLKNNNILLASDISIKALKIAKKNAKTFKVDKNIIFKKADLLNSLLANFPEILKKEKILILANLPYVEKNIWQESDSIKKEPKKALLASGSGLYYYKKLLQQINTNLKNKNIELIMEINPTQKIPLLDYIKQILPNSQTNTIKDLNQKDRLIIVKNYN